MHLGWLCNGVALQRCNGVAAAAFHAGTLEGGVIVNNDSSHLEIHSKAATYIVKPLRRYQCGSDGKRELAMLRRTAPECEALKGHLEVETAAASSAAVATATARPGAHIFRDIFRLDVVVRRVHGSAVELCIGGGWE